MARDSGAMRRLPWYYGLLFVGLAGAALLAGAADALLGLGWFR